MRTPWIRRKNAEAAAAAVRAAWGDALAEGGVIFMAQTAAGADSHIVSSSVTGLLGHDPLDFARPGALRAIVHVDDLATFRAVAQNPHSEASIVRLRHIDGTYRSFRFGVTDRGPHIPLRYTLVDVTADMAAVSHRRRTAEMFRRTRTAVLVIEFAQRHDPSTAHVIEANPAAIELFGISRGSSLSGVLTPASAHLLDSAAFDVASTGERLQFHKLALADFPGRRHEVVVDRLHDGTISLTFTDVTHQAAVEDHLRHLALHDHRTGMPNSALLEDRMTEAARSEQHLHGLLVVEFAGRPLHDELLAQAGRRLSEISGSAALVARIGERRLAVFPPPLVDRTQIVELTRNAAAVLDQPFEVDGEMVSASSTIGAATSDSPDDVHQLLRAAERTLDNAVERGRQWVVQQQPGLHTVTGSVGAVDLVRHGLARGDVELRYQPIVELATGRITKLEALLRWKGDPHGPAAVLGIAERSGLIAPLAHWMMGEAAAAAASLHQVLPGLRIAVNLGALTTHHELDGFLRLLEADGLHAADLLEVEINENDLTTDSLAAADLVNRFQSLGLPVVIDEFGAGFTSLAAIAGLGVAGLKIDRSYIATLTSIPADAAVVASMIDFCRQLEIHSTAVGVADEPTLAHLRSLGCDLAQGFLFSEPLTLDRVAERIAELEAAYL